MIQTAYTNIINKLSYIYWLDYKDHHALDSTKMNPLSLYILLRLYYSVCVTFFDSDKVNYCHALSRLHFVDLEYIDAGLNYKVSHTYCITPIGRRFIDDYIPHPLLMFILEFGSIIFKKLLGIICVIILFCIEDHHINLWFDSLGALTASSLLIMLSLCCSIITFIILILSRPTFWCLPITHVSKREFINFIDNVPISKSYADFVRELDNVNIYKIDYDDLVKIIEYSLFWNN